MSIKRLTSWMTLIEVLITIVVFSIGILTILSVITSSLSIGRRSRNRTTATMLAKEWLEMMYNIRDTNLDKAQPRWCVPVGGVSCAVDLSGNSTNTFTIDGTWLTSIITVVNSLTNSRLYINTWNGLTTYTHVSTNNTPSPFYRYITVSNALLSWDADLINSQIKKITSTVEYSQLGWTGKVELESFIGLTR